MRGSVYIILEGSLFAGRLHRAVRPEPMAQRRGVGH